MEDDIVFPDEVDQPRRGVLPPGLPAVGEQLTGVGDVADRGVKPHVQHFPLSPLDRHRDAPREVAAHGARLQPHIEPALALTVDVGAPLLVLLEDPLGEPVLIVIEREVPVGRRALHRGGAAQLGVGTDQLVRAQLRAALLALIAIRLLIATAGAGADDVSVGEELSRLLIVVLLGRLLDKLPVIIELAEKGGCGLLVDLGRGAGVDVEGDPEVLKGLLDDPMELVHHLLRGDAPLLGLKGDRHTVFIGATDKEHLPSAQSQVAGVDVCRHVDAGEVTDVHRPIGVGQRGGDESSLEVTIILTHDLYTLYYIGHKGTTFRRLPGRLPRGVQG